LLLPSNISIQTKFFTLFIPASDAGYDVDNAVLTAANRMRKWHRSRGEVWTNRRKAAREAAAREAAAAQAAEQVRQEQVAQEQRKKEEEHRKRVAEEKRMEEEKKRAEEFQRSKDAQRAAAVEAMQRAAAEKTPEGRQATTPTSTSRTTGAGDREEEVEVGRALVGPAMAIDQPVAWSATDPNRRLESVTVSVSSFSHFSYI
jgi:hypothetical protein